MELIVVDNACRQETEELLKKYRHVLPLITLKEPVQGKNQALNGALGKVRGELILFTDDDILPHPRLIDVYVEAARLNPLINIFGERSYRQRPSGLARYRF
jgi:cellulose synthase/poly-beta-1,6-N-acetylglucosamine synthase-like glycosyltransferase